MITFRLAGQREGIDILSEPTTIARTGIIPEYIVCQPWIAEVNKDRLLFIFWQVPDTDDQGLVFECHIAAPKEAIRNSRRLASAVVRWLFEHGADKVVTSCPKGKIANMAKRIGLTQTAEVDGMCYFEASAGGDL